jgi:hypothetical protein
MATAEYPSQTGECDDRSNGTPPTPVKKNRIPLLSVTSTDVVEAKIKREDHNLKMWEHASEKLKRLRQELKEAVDKGDIEEIQEIEADIRGFKNRKANFAKLLGLGLD